MQLQAFHNQRPQAIAATGFPQPCGRRSFPTQAFHAATCHVQGSILICCYCNNVIRLRPVQLNPDLSQGSKRELQAFETRDGISPWRV